jgi:hypothetical protein
MKPVEFVVFGGDSSPNTPVHEIAEALQKDIKIYDQIGECQVLSYYYDSVKKRMTLDIGRK